MRSVSIAARLNRIDWGDVERSLSAVGHALTAPILTCAECAALVRLYPDDRHFRSRVVMERFGYGVGDYAYFAAPLPPLVNAIRVNGYRRLAPIANRWMEQLGGAATHPPTLREYLRACREVGQTKPTPLLLHYDRGGYNCLHRDLYGEVAFPLQMTIFLSRPETDYAGGAFLLVEQRPRMQSIGDAIIGPQGSMIIFPTRERPVAGTRGYYRAQVKHGVSRITRGSRYTLGIIFHDAK